MRYGAVLLALLGVFLGPHCFQARLLTAKQNAAQDLSGWNRTRVGVQRLHKVRLPVRPGHGTLSSAANAGATAPRAAESSDSAKVLWLRYTQPRPISVDPEHEDEALDLNTFLVQNLDHLDPDSRATWTQRYLRNRASYREGGPAFVMLSGTADYESDWLREGHMADLARKLNADRFFLMTRFFDPQSPPTEDASTDNLRAYLNVEQALQDVISFLESMQEKGILRQDQKVILFGAGFGGALATWARMRFPDIVSGVVASSPTLEARFDTYSYFPVVGRAVDWYHKKNVDCMSFVRRAFKALDSALSTAEGRAEFNDKFQPCSPFPVNQTVTPDDRAQVLGLVASALADLVQEDEDGPLDPYANPGNDKLYPVCLILSESKDTPLVTLGRLVATLYDGVCLETSFQGLVSALQAEDWGSDANMGFMRPWFWLQCTELGQLPTTTGNIYAFPFSERIGMSFYRKLCDAVFGAGTTSSLVANISSLNSIYGGKKPDISNAIFVKADLDPWRDLSPDEGLTGTEVHVFNVLRASHAHDMFPRNDYDPPWMKKTRKAIATILSKWLS